MGKLLSILMLLLALPGFSARSMAQANDEQSRILTLENAWNQAIQQKDGTALKILLAPELVYVDYDGAVAVVAGVCRETGIKNGKPYAVLIRFTDTSIRRGESWICVASHSTLIPR